MVSYPRALRAMAVLGPAMFVGAFVAALFVPLMSDYMARIVGIAIAMTMTLSLGLMSLVGFVGRWWARAARTTSPASAS